MASIFQQPGSPYWHARFKRAETGQWGKLSTKIRVIPLFLDGKSLKEAKRHAEEAALRFAYELEAKHVGTPVFRAFQKEARRKADAIEPGAARLQTVRDFFQSFLGKKEKAVTLDHLAQSTFDNYSMHARHFLEWLGAKAESPVINLMSSTMEDYRDQLVSEGKSTTTVSKYLKSLSVPLNEAWHAGKLEVNPVKPVKPPRGQANKREPFTAAEIRKLLETATGEWKTLVMLGIYTGARLGDCVRLRWEGVDLFKGTVSFTQEKTKRHGGGFVTIPLHESLWEHLKQQGGGTGLLLPTLSAKINDEKTAALSTEFMRLMEAAGVSKKSKEGKAGRSFSAKSFHSLRHTLTSSLAEKGVSVEVRSSITGHKLKGINQHYTHTEIETAREGLAKVAF